MKTLPPEEYYASLPTKVIGSSLLIRNDKNEILLVKPTYRKEHLFPGGTVEKEESLTACAERETKEELGIDIKSGRLLALGYKKNVGIKPEMIQCIFDGGIITDEIIATIKTRKDEIDRYEFKAISEAIKLLSPERAYRTEKAFEALADGTTAYLEDGVLIK